MAAGNYEGSLMRTTGLRAATILPMVALVLAACGGGTSGGQRLTGGTATFAELPDPYPNYIFPRTSGRYFSVSNHHPFQFPVFQPRYRVGPDSQGARESSPS